MGETITLDKLKRELEEIIRKSIKEEITQQFMKLRAEFLPFVSDAEQKDIENLYGKTPKKREKIVHQETVKL